MTSCRQLEIQFEDHNAQKWCHPLKEEALAAFMGKENPTVRKVFDEKCLFSPLLFGKFFDPSDAFPLWEFEPDILLPNLNSSVQRSVDWLQTDADYVLKAELPEGTGVGNGTLQVCVEGGKVLEISGQWRQHNDPRRRKDWRSSHWWEHGYVRRLELPENSDWRKLEANVKNDLLLEIRIPKIYLEGDTSRAN